MQNLKKIYILIFIIFIPVFVLAKETNIPINAKKIWTVPAKIFVNQKIRIYTTFTNTNNYDIENTIEFSDNKKIIGIKSVSIAAGKNITLWHDYIIKNTGTHNLEAKITKTIEDNLYKKIEKTPIPIINSKKIITDYDTDGDNIGDAEDPDDDNDGYTDKEEVTAGSDPKSKVSTPKTKKIQEQTSNTISLIKEVGGKSIDSVNKKTKDVAKILKEKINEIEKTNISNNQPEIINIENTQINTDQRKKIERNIFEKIWLIILKFLYFIFSYLLTSIIFFLLIFYLIWKIIKLIFRKND